MDDIDAVAGYYALYAQGRLAKDQALAPMVVQQVALAEMSARAFDLYRLITLHAGTGLIDALQKSAGVTDELESRLRPGDWWERVVKTYVTIGMWSDALQTLTGERYPDVEFDFGHQEWASRLIEAGCAADDRLSARLSLWGRRVNGDAVSAVRAVVHDYPETLNVETETELYHDLREGHTLRMQRAGLAA